MYPADTQGRSTSSRPGSLGFLLQLFGLQAASGEAQETRESIVAGSISSGTVTFPYRLRDDFLSPTDLSLYRMLTLALEGRALIFPSRFVYPRFGYNRT